MGLQGLLFKSRMDTRFTLTGSPVRTEQKRVKLPKSPKATRSNDLLHCLRINLLLFCFGRFPLPTRIDSIKGVGYSCLWLEYESATLLLYILSGKCFLLSARGFQGLLMTEKEAKVQCRPHSSADSIGAWYITIGLNTNWLVGMTQNFGRLRLKVYRCGAGMSA